MHVAKRTNAVNLDAYAGRPTPLHANAAGKAMLAQLPEQRIDEMLPDLLLSASNIIELTLTYGLR